MGEVRDRLNHILRGWWSAYFPAAPTPEVNRYVAARVRHFLTRCHKVQSRGTERYGDEWVFGELRVTRVAHQIA